MLNTGISGVLGLGFWLAAAHYYSADAVGQGSAAIAAMKLLAGLAALTLMGALARFIPIAGASTGRFIFRTYAGSSLAVALAAAVFLFTLDLWGGSYSFLHGTLNGIGFLLAVVAWSLLTLQDGVLTGLRNALWVPVGNTVFSIVKLVLLVAFAAAIPTAGVFVSWVAAIAVSVVPLGWLVFRRLVPRHVAATADRAAPPTLRELGRFLAGDYTGSLFSLAVVYLVPVLIASQVSSADNAYFYIATTIGGTVNLLAINMGASLTVEGAHDPAQLAANCRAALRRMARLMVPICTLMFLGAPLILRVFGSDYADAATPLLRWFAVGALLRVVIETYFAVLRAQSRTAPLAYLQGVLCALVIGLTLVLLPRMGLTGAGVAEIASLAVVASVAGFQMWRLVRTAPPAERRRPAVAPDGDLADLGTEEPDEAAARPAKDPGQRPTWALRAALDSDTMQLGIPLDFDHMERRPDVRPGPGTPAAGTPTLNLQPDDRGGRREREDHRERSDHRARGDHQAQEHRRERGDHRQQGNPGDRHDHRQQADHHEPDDHRQQTDRREPDDRGPSDRKPPREVPHQPPREGDEMDHRPTWALKVPPAPPGRQPASTPVPGPSQEASQEPEPAPRDAEAAGASEAAHESSAAAGAHESSALAAHGGSAVAAHESSALAARESSALAGPGGPQARGTAGAPPPPQHAPWPAAPPPGPSDPSPDPDEGTPVKPAYGVIALLITALTLFWVPVLKLREADLDEMGGLGLISVLPPVTLIGAALLVVTFASLLWHDRPHRLLLAAALIATLFSLHALPAVIEAEPRFATAWQHLGFMEYIDRTGSSVPELDARWSWPGFFAVATFAAEACGVTDLTGLIRWWPLAMQLLYLAPMFLLVRSMRASWRAKWAGVWIFVLSGWVGQDYFSPQGFTYLLYIAFVAILLVWFRAPRMLAARRRPGEAEVLPSTRGQRATLLLILVALFAATVPAHQLTPFVMLGVLSVLVLMGRSELRGLPILFTVLVTVWVGFLAEPYWKGHFEDLFGGVGGVGGNVTSSVGGRIEGGSSTHQLVLYVRVLLAGAVMALACWGWWRRRNHKYAERSLLVLTFVPFLGFGMQSYGGEMALRVFMFALPGAALLAGLALFPRTGRTAQERDKDKVSLAPLAALLAGLLLVGGFLVARWGNEPFERIRPGEVAAMEYVYDHDEPTVRLLWMSNDTVDNVTPALPWGKQDMEKVEYMPTLAPADPVLVGSLVKALKKAGPQSYLIINKSQSVYLTMDAGYPKNWDTRLIRNLDNRPELKKVYANSDATLYALTKRPDGPVAKAHPGPIGPLVTWTPWSVVGALAALALIALLAAREVVRVAVRPSVRQLQWLQSTYWFSLPLLAVLLASLVQRFMTMA
ncbi:polysaccharide biosynthesis C-terminal domain-containing protein [Streptomyces sp. NBC_01304]|nr:polysaccharide biosynthesis C-terminal domain-containing protein [Streptomyces sp. NBC_01304]